MNFQQVVLGSEEGQVHLQSYASGLLKGNIQIFKPNLPRPQILEANQPAYVSVIDWRIADFLAH